MKYLPIITTFLICFSCGVKSKDDISQKYIIQTKVKIKEGKINDVLELFKSTNPDLVRDQQDWLSASFTTQEDENIVIVNAVWKSKASYLKFSNSEKFKNTMKQFGKYFEGKPDVTITKVLFEM